MLLEYLLVLKWVKLYALCYILCLAPCCNFSLFVLYMSLGMGGVAHNPYLRTKG